MTDEQILMWAARFHYAQLVISSSLVIRHGQQEWIAALPALSQEQRETLLERIDRWNELANYEVAS